MNWKTGIFVALVFVTFAFSNATTNAQGTGYYPYVIARGQDRERIRNTPIELRPNRPLHFYGNAVRRRYYGRPLISPTPMRELIQPVFPQARPQWFGQRTRFSPFIRR